MNEELRLRALRVLNEHFKNEGHLGHLEDRQVKLVINAMVDFNQCENKLNVISDSTSKSRGCCSECGEGYDNEEEWMYNTECELCGHPIPEHLIIKK